MTRYDSAADATVRRWQLCETLKQAREQLGMSHDEVVAAIGTGRGNWSSPKMSRLENRQHKIKELELNTLMDTYNLTDPAMRAWLHELRTTADQRGYWTAFRKDLPKDFHRVIDVEGALVSQRQFETMLVPGLLQTPDFARALINGLDPALAPDVVERRVIARMARQQVLTRPVPLRLHVILDEAILERPVGTAVIMRKQMQRLLEETETDHVSIQILPKSAGASPGLKGPFYVMSLPEPIPDFGYAEGSGRGLYVDEREVVREYTLRFGILTKIALSQAESVDLIAGAVKRYE